ncbi:hypothetical protein ACIQ9E_14150 [Streptomyces sp. NPDC094448]|uniref:hypothetical protein n=1 Tax=Streptomyces sp. NPDC094448 TaxID=3366063 RepID=UPI00380705ED
MLWPVLAIVLGFAGIAVLGALGIRVFVEARRLGREVARATERIGQASESLERAAGDLARNGGRTL